MKKIGNIIKYLVLGFLMLFSVTSLSAATYSSHDSWHTIYYRDAGRDVYTTIGFYNTSNYYPYIHDGWNGYLGPKPLAQSTSTIRGRTGAGTSGMNAHGHGYGYSKYNLAHFMGTTRD